ncbi:MAG: D-alanyl-D-alanine carboxypeptidase/D-alanyl-D-alanine endopeptidase [Candidatus Eutrophobiaceae bacterium]
MSLTKIDTSLCRKDTLQQSEFPQCPSQATAHGGKWPIWVHSRLNMQALHTQRLAWRIIHSPALLLALLASALLAPLPLHCVWAAELPAEVRNLMKRHRVPDSSMSIYVKELGASKPLIFKNASTPRNPASVIKAVVTLAALEKLGPNYSWTSDFLIDGQLLSGKLHGNLVFRGSGDPFLTREVFLQALQSMRQRGLREIQGDLIIDNSLFENISGNPGDFDQRPYRAYNALPNASLVNFNALKFHLFPEGKRVHIHAEPDLGNLKIRNLLQLVKGRCLNKNHQINMMVGNKAGITTVTFSGKFASDCEERTYYRSVIPGNEYFYGAFKANWESLGGSIQGRYHHMAADYKKAKLFHSIESKPLHHIIELINKYSNNVMVRQLLISLGNEQFSASGSPRRGEESIKIWLQTLGISAPELIIENGAGLSRKSRISAHTLAQLLKHAWRSRYHAEFLASLSLNGLDGTLKKRLDGKIPPGVVRAKTGSINNVRSIAGYLHSKSGKRFLFVMLQNSRGAL